MQSCCHVFRRPRQGPHFSSVSNVDTVVIPSQHGVTQQLLSHWKTFQDLKLMFPDSRRAEQLNLHSQQRIVGTVEDSVLRTEMTGLESQEEDAPKRILFFKAMSWLGQIRSHRRDETWSASLWKTLSLIFSRPPSFPLSLFPVLLSFLSPSPSSPRFSLSPSVTPFPHLPTQTLSLRHFSMDLFWHVVDSCIYLQLKSLCLLCMCFQVLIIVPENVNQEGCYSCFRI